MDEISAKEIKALKLMIVSATISYYEHYGRPGTIMEIAAHSGMSQYILRKWIDSISEVKTVWIDKPVRKRNYTGIKYYRKTWGYVVKNT